VSGWDLLIGGYNKEAPGAGGPAAGQPGVVRVARLDDQGHLTDAGRLDGGVNPSWITVHPTRPVAYACNEDFAPGVVGSVVTWDVGRGAPESRAGASTGGHAPCHAVVAPDGEDHALVVSHYVGGQVSVVPLDREGLPYGSASDVITHMGASFADRERQEAPHPHQATLDPVSGLIWVSDLGQDRVVGYRLWKGKLRQEAEQMTPPGFGPRHTALHPGRDHLALVGELANEVIVYRRDPTRSGWLDVSRHSTLPAGWSGENGAAALVWSSDGRHLYASNRGHDSVAVWNFDVATARLALRGHSAVGASPRDFCLTPDGRWALSAAQGEHRAIAFPVLPSGLLGPETDSIECAYAARVAVVGHPRQRQANGSGGR